MSSGRLARRLAAILAADVVGYSRLMGDDEAGTLARLNALRNEVIDPAVALHRGRIFKTTGDGLLIEFASVVDAIESAVAVQHAISAREAAVADDRRIVLRIGINLGDVIVEGDDIHGDGVNVAARLEAAADPGGVLISQIVHDSIAGKLDIAFHDSGERAFKNIANPIRVWSWPEKLTRVAAAGLEAARDAKPLIMVGAFEARREEEAELAQGLRDELATAFSRLTGLVVTDDPAAARYVVRGGVRLAGSRCRISAQLIGVDGERQLWAERYDEDYDDPFDVLDRCVPRIAMSVRRRTAADDAGRLADRETDRLSHGELLSLAGATFFTPTKAAWLEAGAIAERALERQPDNFMGLAMAAAGLGMAESLFGCRAPDEATIEVAFRRIEHAQRMTDSSDMIVVVYSGLQLYGRRRHAEATAAAERALQLNPDFNQGLWARGAAAVFAGDYDAGIAAAARAVDIDIRDPYVHLYSRIAGYGHFAATRYAEAVGWFWKADQSAPGLPHNLAGLAASHWLDDDKDGAHGALACLLDAEPAFRLTEYFRLPFRDQAVCDRLVEALRSAGAPD